MIRSPYALILVLLVSSSGCGSSSGPTPSSKDVEQGVMYEVGELYRIASVSLNKPPASFADLKQFGDGATQGYEAVRSGNVIVRYGAKLTSLLEGPPEGTSDEVVAYEKQVPESGGQVLMLNRAVKKMTAEEFKAAPKAGK